MNRLIAILSGVAALVIAPSVHSQVSQQALTTAEVGRIISQAAQEAQARNVAATISVVDRVGNVLAVFQCCLSSVAVRMNVTAAQ